MDVPFSPPAFLGWLLALSGLVLAGCSPQPAEEAEEGPRRVDGHRIEVGEGTVSTFARLGPDGAPEAIGVSFSPEAVEQPPTGLSDEHHCADFDGNGTVDRPDECAKWHEFVVPLPSEVNRSPDIPFSWALINWNPKGHIPPEVYGLPHFDVHFYMKPIAEVLALRPGECGPEHMRCDHFEQAVEPVPPNYKPADFENVKAAAPAMGNHLVDPTGPEFQGETFTRAWVYGSYGGEIIFYEEMVTQAYLLSQPDTCYPIKQPEAVEEAGYYPTESCIRYHPERNRYQVVMEGFRMREAGPADPISASTDE